LIDWLSESSNHRKGEMVVLVAGSDRTEPQAKLDSQAILTTLLPYLPVKEAAKLTAELTGESRNSLYKQALELRQKK